jgi:hypothetical protein
VGRPVRRGPDGADAADGGRTGCSGIRAASGLDVETGGASVVPYARTFTGSALIGWVVLAGSAAALTVATMWVLHWKCRPGRP